MCTFCMYIILPFKKKKISKAIIAGKEIRIQLVTDLRLLTWDQEGRSSHYQSYGHNPSNLLSPYSDFFKQWYRYLLSSRSGKIPSCSGTYTNIVLGRQPFTQDVGRAPCLCRALWLGNGNISDRTITETVPVSPEPTFRCPLPTAVSILSVQKGKRLCEGIRKDTWLSRKGDWVRHLNGRLQPEQT